MKRKLFLFILLVSSIACFFIACKKENAKTVSVNCGTEIDLVEYFGVGDTILNAKLFDVNGKEISVGNGKIYLSSLGEYKLVLQSGTTYYFSSQDLEGPIATLKNQSTVVYKGDFVNTEVVFTDKAGASVKSQTITIKKDGKEVQVSDGGFIASELGDYIIYVQAVDTNGNEKLTEIKIESIETVYGKGIYVIPEQDDAEITVHREKYTEGENVGKYRTVIRKDYYKTGFGYLTIKATKDAGLKANTYYGLTVRVDSEYDSWCYYNPDNEWLTKKSSPTINFTVKTDENGEYYKRWWTYQSYSSCFDFSSVTFHEYVYGNGIDLNIAQKEGLSVQDELFEERTDGNVYIKRLERKSSDFATLTVSASKIANLLPNTQYKLVINADCDGDYPAYYESYDKWHVGNGKSKIETVVTTDGNGEFKISWNTYFAKGTYVRFTGVSITQFNGYVYGEGVNLEVTPQNKLKLGLTNTDELLSQNANDFLYVKRLERVSSEFAKLTVTVDKSANLLPNSLYKLIITTDCDGEYPSYYESYDKWHVGKDKNKIEVNVYTDANGEFKISWSTYFRTGTFVRFLSVDFEHVNYAYPLGVYITPSCAFGSVTEQTLSNGQKIVVINKDTAKEGASKLTVSAVKEAGLKANTTYTVKIKIDTDKDTFWSYYSMNDEWKVKQSQPYAEFDIVTDEKGEFTKTFDKVYFGTNCTYAKFSEIILTEKNI